MQGNGCVASGKHKRTKQRWLHLHWKNHDWVKSFVLHSHTIHELRNQNTEHYKLVPKSGVNNNCVLRMVNTKKANKTYYQEL